MLLELFLGLLVLLLICDFFNKRRREQIYSTSGIKGPIALPLIGASFYLIKQTPETIFLFFDNFIKKYGRSFRMWILHEGVIFTADVKLIEAILSSQQVITKNRLYDLLLSWLGTGLLLSTGKKWFSRRKIITPTFHFNILKQFVEIFEQQSTIMVQKLYKHADGKTVINMFPIVCLEALDIIAETAMGVKINAQAEEDFPYVKAVRTAAHITSLRFMRPAQRFDGIMRYFAPLEFRRLQRNIKIMHVFADKVIRDRRAILEKSINDGTFKKESVHVEAQNDVGTKKRMALLDVLLQSTINDNALSNEDIREEVDTFMFEGHDTTTSSISHTIYLISRHPDVQKKLFDEICTVIGCDKDRAVSMQELQELKYLECVIKESLRLYPPVPMIGRYTHEDIMLNDQLVPAKTNIVLLIYRVMRDPAYFENPNDFKPERFDTSNDVQMNPFAFIPFSAGPRNCIGQKFAILEMKSTISKTLRHFELLPLGEAVRPLMNLILRSATGTQLGLRPRVY